MKIFSICFFIIFLFYFDTKGEDRFIDSMYHAISKAKSDTAKSRLLSELSFYYGEGNPDSAFYLANLGLKLAKKNRQLAVESACKLAMAFAYTTMGAHHQALEMSLRALKDAENIKDKRLMIRIYNNIGFLYLEIGDNKKALEYYYKILPLLSAVHQDKNIITSLYINLGFVHERMDRLDSAKFYNNKAYDIAIQGLEYGYQVIVMNNFGNIYMKMRQPEMALINYRQCLPYAYSTNWISIICESSMGIAKIYKAKQQPDSAIQYAKAGVLAAMNAQYTKFVMEGSSFLADIYKSSEKLDSAVKYLSLAMAAKDSLFNRDKLNKLKAIDFEEISRQQEMAQAEAVALNERKQNIQYAIIAIGIICLVVLLLLLSRSIIVNQNWIRFFGVMSLLLVFEFINLYLHPYLSVITHHSPILMLLAMVLIAVFLIPMHHKLEHWGIKLLVEKNKKIRLETAKKIVAELEEKD